jgi:ribosomal protein S18 acetylase RimI-like enzyme
MHLPDHTIRLIAPHDAVQLQSLLESDPGYFEIVQGAPPGPAEAQSLVTALPEGKDYGDKFVYVVFDRQGARESALAAAIDLIRGYPENGVWYLGLLFVAPSARNVGLGTRLLDAACAHVKREGGHALRLGAVRGNVRARALYERNEFRFIYERERTQPNGFAVLVDVLERTL